jgi:hypothetical protein
LPSFPSWLRQSYEALCNKERRSRSRTPERARRRSRSPPVRYTRERSRSPPQRFVDNRVDGLRQDLESTRALVLALQKDVATLTTTNAGLINVVRCLVENAMRCHPQQQVHPCPQPQNYPQQQIQPDYISSLIATINKK